MAGPYELAGRGGATLPALTSNELLSPQHIRRQGDNIEAAAALPQAANSLADAEARFQAAKSRLLSLIRTSVDKVAAGVTDSVTNGGSANYAEVGYGSDGGFDSTGGLHSPGRGNGEDSRLPTRGSPLTQILKQGRTANIDSTEAKELMNALPLLQPVKPRSRQAGRRGTSGKPAPATSPGRNPFGGSPQKGGGAQKDFDLRLGPAYTQEMEKLRRKQLAEERERREASAAKLSRLSRSGHVSPTKSSSAGHSQGLGATGSLSATQRTMETEEEDHTSSGHAAERMVNGRAGTSVPGQRKKISSTRASASASSSRPRARNASTAAPAAGTASLSSTSGLAPSSSVILPPVTAETSAMLGQGGLPGSRSPGTAGVGMQQYEGYPGMQMGGGMGGFMPGASMGGMGQLYGGMSAIGGVPLATPGSALGGSMSPSTMPSGSLFPAYYMPTPGTAGMPTQPPRAGTAPAGTMGGYGMPTPGAYGGYGGFPMPTPGGVTPGQPGAAGAMTPGSAQAGSFLTYQTLLMQQQQQMMLLQQQQAAAQARSASTSPVQVPQPNGFYGQMVMPPGAMGSMIAPASPSPVKGKAGGPGSPEPRAKPSSAGPVSPYLQPVVPRSLLQSSGGSRHTASRGKAGSMSSPGTPSRNKSATRTDNTASPGGAGRAQAPAAVSPTPVPASYSMGTARSMGSPVGNPGKQPAPAVAMVPLSTLPGGVSPGKSSGATYQSPSPAPVPKPVLDEDELANVAETITSAVIARGSREVEEEDALRAAAEAEALDRAITDTAASMTVAIVQEAMMEHVVEDLSESALMEGYAEIDSSDGGPHSALSPGSGSGLPEGMEGYLDMASSSPSSSPRKPLEAPPEQMPEEIALEPPAEASDQAAAEPVPEAIAEAVAPEALPQAVAQPASGEVPVEEAIPSAQ